ncbi:DHA2 family efflux MFS transporter permease subunit [Streptomyces sp. HNM0663]|uniref:DHA2 family efflux MFS transporter permease subunit n=1 Tax=Streptomyces chengmaiensis TaxID=3040919 RepID=A0ABT6HHK9_9ACTN|nr:DHA2 family efflux MFS transporter permease subunit [Streptomyces chengmaiensis]MDH2387826.1 DHA2 family efflux MFS transporter permease subunit [Streptomyces chengmaiensis]
MSSGARDGTEGEPGPRPEPGDGDASPARHAASEAGARRPDRPAPAGGGSEEGAGLEAGGTEAAADSEANPEADPAADPEAGPVPEGGAGGLRLASAVGRWVVLTTVLGSAMALLDSTVVTVALPRIGEDLDADLGALQWTVNAYMLTLASLILLGGALGDRYGRRKIFVLGVVWFAAGSLLCGLAPDESVLIAARALQGIGGALLTPGSLAIIQASFHPDDRARAVGLWSGFGGVGAAVGPFVGGWLVDGPGWRWVFLINVPLAALCVPVALKQVPESRDLQARGRFDVLGAALGALALGLVTYALIAPAVWAGAAGAAAGVAFVLVERRRPEPMLPPSIFAVRQFTVVNLVTLCVYAAFGGFFFLAVLQLQVVAGYSALAAGTALLPTTVLMLLLSAKSGELGDRIGPRIPLTVGPLLCAAGMLLMLRVGEDASYATDVLPAMAVLGAGMVTLVAPLTATVLASVDPGRAGLASGVNNAAARAAGLVAVAALPLLVGMGPEAYRSAAEFGEAFRRALPLLAGVLAAGAAIAWWAVRPKEAELERCHPECRVNCGVSAPPLEPPESGQAP